MSKYLLHERKCLSSGPKNNRKKIFPIEVVIASDNKHIAINFSTYMKIYNLQTCMCVYTFEKTSNLYIGQIEFSPNAKYITMNIYTTVFSYSTCQYIVEPSYLLGITVWDMQTGDLLYRIPNTRGIVKHSMFLQNGNFFAFLIKRSIYGRPYVGIWNFETQKILRYFTLNTEDEKELFSKFIEKSNVPGDFELYSHSNFDVDTNDINILKIDDNEILYKLECRANCSRLIRYSSDGKFIASISENEAIKIWDKQIGKLICDIDLGNRIWYMAFSPNCKYIVCCANSNIYMFDCRTGEQLYKLIDKDRKYYSENINKYAYQSMNYIVFSPDSKNMISLLTDNIEIYDVKTGRLLYTFIINCNLDDMTYYVEYSNNNKYIISCSCNCVKIWKNPLFDLWELRKSVLLLNQKSKNKNKFHIFDCIVNVASYLA